MTDARFSIIPAGAVLDHRLEPRDLQVLCLFGKHTDRKGWCRRSQVAMSKEIGCARSTVQASIDRLVEAGWIQKRPVSDLHTPGVRDSAHEYRVVLDTADEPQDVAGTLPTDRHPPADPTSAPPADTWIGTYVNGSTSNEKKEGNSISKGRAASPSADGLVVAGPGEPGFEAVAKLRNKRPVIGKSGRTTFTREEVERALIAFPPPVHRSRVAVSEDAA